MRSISSSSISSSVWRICSRSWAISRSRAGWRRDLGQLGRSRPFILLYFRPWSDCPPKVRKTPKLEINQSIPGLETCLVSLPRFRCSGTAAPRGCRPAFLMGVGYFPQPATETPTHRRQWRNGGDSSAWGLRQKEECNNARML